MKIQIKFVIPAIILAIQVAFIPGALTKEVNSLNPSVENVLTKKDA